jgi:hypothetical protein
VIKQAERMLVKTLLSGCRTLVERIMMTRGERSPCEICRYTICYMDGQTFFNVGLI